MKMLKFIVSLLGLIIVMTLVLVSCKREESFPVVPSISMVEFKGYGSDSAICRINFTDGDGDIGLDPFDTVAPYNRTSKYFYDMFLVYYYDTLGVWKPFNQHPADTAHSKFDTLQYTYRIPNLTQNGQAKALQGEIKVKIPAPYAIPGQTYKYTVLLVDRALHHSNIVETPPQKAP
ncbi:MAG TPA: hypothetical protein VNZ86_03615 [Bacteroidia bacterium]|jgi:hypothetical protein|nr:hypothetical protein [Bacteroidia bacterium]